MRKIRFTEHQIIAVLKSVEAGRTVKDVCREAGISEASYYNWKAKFGGMDASDIKKMKDLEDENRRLKQMFADLSLECRALKRAWCDAGVYQARQANAECLYRTVQPDIQNRNTGFLSVQNTE